MSATHDLAALNAVGKELYDGQKIVEMFLYKNPAMTLMPKKTDAVGEVYPIPIIVGGPQGASNTFSNALANQYATNTRRFNLTRSKIHQVATIDRETMLAIKGNKGAFKDAVRLAVDGAVKALRNTISVQIWGDGTGTLGSYASGGISSGVITLADPSTVRRFEIGMKLTVGTVAGTVAYSAAGYVIRVDEGAGTVTVATSQGGAAATPTSWDTSATHYIMLDGCENAAIKGIPAWLPSSAPSSSDNWFGVNRSEHSRLSGVRYDGSAAGLSIRETLVKLASLICAAGSDADPSHCFVSHASYTALDYELMGKAIYCDVEGTAKLKFKGIRLPTENGEVIVLPDRSVPGRKAYMLTMDNWKLYSVLDVPHVQADEGLDMFTRDPNSDGYQARFSAYCNPGCNAPGYSGVATLSA